MTEYRIDSDRSEVHVEARSNVHPIEIKTQGLVGKVVVDVRDGKLDIAGSMPEAEVEIAADRLRSGIDLYDSEIHRRIEVRKFRTIKGQLREARELSPGRYELRGTLSLHGVTREIDGEVTVRVRDGDGSLEIEGSKTIDMREFNLEPPKILMLEVQPHISIRAKICAVRAR
jgi:polyisoprenoid-binding protein YceI